MANAVTQEILKELKERGALADKKVDAQELARYLTSNEAKYNQSQLYANRAAYIRDSGASERDQVRWLAGLIIEDLKDLEIPVVASEGELVRALNSPIIKAGLRGTQK